MCFSTFLPLLWHVLWPVNWSLVKTWSFYQLSTQTGGLLVNLPLLKMFSASSAQQVALIGSCTYPSLVNMSLWWLKDCPRKPGISHLPCQELTVKMKEDVSNQIGCQHIQSSWQFLSDVLLFLMFMSWLNVQNAFSFLLLYIHLNKVIRKYLSPCYRSAKICRGQSVFECSSILIYSMRP